MAASVSGDSVQLLPHYKQIENHKWPEEAPIQHNLPSTEKYSRKKLKKEIKNLEVEIEHIEALIEEEERYTSSSRDARKMYGDITPGDITHGDVVLEYQNHFKSAHRNLPKSLPDKNKYEVWRMSSDIVQESFDVNKKDVIEKMITDLKCSLQLTNDKPGPLSESKHDLHRAFKMMVLEMNDDDITQLKKAVVKDNKDEAAFEIVMKMILELDPCHYKSFLTTGKLRNRTKDLEYQRSNKN